MSALLDRVIDDDALCPPVNAPMAGTLSAYRAAAQAPAAGRLRCPASRFAELRTHLVPEDLLDLVVVADAGVEGLPETLEAVRSEPRVRPCAMEITLPRGADQARAAAVTLARLPSGLPAYIGLGRAPGWRDALDGIAAARDHAVREGGCFLGAHLGVPGPEAADFIVACVERSLRFTAVAGVPGRDPLKILLATAQAATGGDAVRRTLARTDGLAAEIRALGEDEARAVRRHLTALAVPDLGEATSALALIGNEAFTSRAR
jgi:hypothetical protein